MRDLELVEDDVFCVGELLDTSKGKDLQVILQAGGTLGLSIRGHGNMKDAKMKNDKDEEIDVKEITNYQLAGVDFVLNPSFDSHVSKENMFESVGLEEVKEKDNLSIEEQRESYKESFKKIFDDKQDAGEIELEEEFSSWLEDAGLSDLQIDKLIENDRKTLGLSELQLYEEALDSGYAGNFESWKEDMDK